MKFLTIAQSLALHHHTTGVRRMGCMLHPHTRRYRAQTGSVRAELHQGPQRRRPVRAGPVASRRDYVQGGGVRCPSRRRRPCTWWQAKLCSCSAQHCTLG